ncbi:hypothetical protein N802_04000 [Knoellia sinensis KCTC 19936]|uniref:Uncharacterized protein n=1 Tax=Knoellia sinensis KCTC 19936 TaxID=1385520 RepID=A0A0A0J7I5_9MICO|nr:hypothetical protein [Knoellia sinensis]KGN31541.1 hypothetical protein N802_04000 [Knoellia sinensis KCTC 19936]
METTTPPRLKNLALAGTLLALAAGALWTLRPETVPYAGTSEVLLGTWLPQDRLGLPLLVASLLGTAALTAGSRLPRAAFGGVATAEAATLLVGYQGSATMPTFGYALAMCIPVLLVVVGALAIVRMPRWRVPLLGLTAGVVAAGAWSGVLTWSNVRSTLGAIVGKLADSPFFFANLATVAVGLAWVALLVTTFPGAVRRATGWVTRHRRGFTVGAILCAAPYGLARLMWLTPWPLENLLDTSTRLELDDSTRLWGLMLGSACLLGAILTSGLISRWGEVFPRWIPGYAGRPVPVALAAVPGFTVATALLAGAPSMMAINIDGTLQGWLVALLVFPFAPWGILLGLAVWGYLGHRQVQHAAVTTQLAAVPR